MWTRSWVRPTSSAISESLAFTSDKGNTVIDQNYSRLWLAGKASQGYGAAPASSDLDPDRVRACSCSTPSGPGLARTHDGRGQLRELPSAVSGQVSSYTTARGQAVCKNRRLSLRWFEPNTCHHQRKRPVSWGYPALAGRRPLCHLVSSAVRRRRCAAV